MENGAPNVLQRDAMERRQRVRRRCKTAIAAERLSTSDIAQISEWIERNNPDLGAIESHPVKSMAARGN
jgi:cytochrome c553